MKVLTFGSLLVLLTVMLIAQAAWGRGFLVESADVQIVGDVYELNADLRLELSAPAIEAMRNGVAVTLVFEAEVLARRSWLWDRVVGAVEQRYRIEYHTLAGQYLVNHLNTGQVKSFPTIGLALDAIGRIRGWPLIDRSLLAADAEHYGRVRARLDIDALPAPLQPRAYLSSDWRLSSEWYRWALG